MELAAKALLKLHAIMAGGSLATLALLLAVSAGAQAQLPPPLCTKLDRATLEKLKHARHGEWTLSEAPEPENGAASTTPLAKYRTGQECEREADQLRADWCLSFECTDRYHCPLFQPFHPDDPGGPKAVKAARQLGKKLRGKVPGLLSVCAGIGSDFGQTEITISVLERTPAVQAAVPTTFGGFPVDIWPVGEARFN